MHGTTSTARQVAAGGHAGHAGIAQRAAPPDYGSPGVRRPGTAARIPPFAVGQDDGLATQWPLQSFLELGALPGAVPCARLHTRHVLWEWGVASLAESTELVVSEMITNAVQVSRAMTQTAVRLWLVSDRARVMVLAWDASPLPPVRGVDPSEDAENGRGLLLVDAISEQWGWYVPSEHGSTSAREQPGKVVWAVVLLTTWPAISGGDSNGDINAGTGDNTVTGGRFSLADAGSRGRRAAAGRDHAEDDPPPATWLQHPGSSRTSLGSNDSLGARMDQREIERTVAAFYRTGRAGAGRLSDGGGPFGFDIAVALLADELISGYGCDAIAETGCFLGDTTGYLARRYPGLPVYTCDIEPGFCAFTARRLADCANVTVSREDSPPSPVSCRSGGDAFGLRRRPRSRRACHWHRTRQRLIVAFVLNLGLVAALVTLFHMLAMSLSTRSSTERNGSLHSTVR